MLEAYWSWSVYRTLLVTPDIQLFLQPALTPSSDLAAVFTGSAVPAPPTLGKVCATVRRHAELLVELMGEPRGLTDLRKHMAWYFKGFVVGADVRSALGKVSSIVEMDTLLAQIDPDQAFPASEIGVPRGRQGSPRRAAP